MDPVVRDAVEQAQNSFRLFSEGPSLNRLMLGLRHLAELQGGQLAAALDAIGRAWLQEQGELVVQLSVDGVRNAVISTATELRELRELLVRFGVSCDGWEVSAGDIDQAILRYARSQYERAVRDKSLYAGWQVFEVWARGDIPSLDMIGPGAHEVVLQSAISYAHRAVCEGPDYDVTMAEIILEKMSKYVPVLDGATLSRFAASGIPTDAKVIQHTLKVIHIRRDWEAFQSESGDALDVAAVCNAVFVEQSIDAAELGTTSQELWSAAKQWVDSLVTQIRAGQYDAVGDISTLVDFSELSLEDFGLTVEQYRAWLESRAQAQWAQAQAGDGLAAFRVLVYCESDWNLYERTTGLSREVARPHLQAITAEYAAGLRMQIETATRPEWARVPYETLRHLRSYAYSVRHATAHDGGPLVDVSAWYMTPSESHEFFNRYVQAAYGLA